LQRVKVGPLAILDIIYSSENSPREGKTNENEIDDTHELVLVWQMN
jgi:hypothetical protein